MNISTKLAVCSFAMFPLVVVAQNAAPSAPSQPDADMAKVLSALEQLGPKPLPQLTPEEARKQPTPADAAMKVMKDEKIMAPMPKVAKKDMSYETEGGRQPIRIYTPAAANQSAPLPVIVYYHGGGWVIADIATYDASATALASKANAIVASVEYRHAPEAKFPAAHEDAFAAYQWVLANGKSFGGDPHRVAVAGESAGGNLAANVAIMARDKKIQEPVHMLLVYPVAGSDMNTPSYVENANAKPLSKSAMQWFVKYALKPQDAKSPMINLVAAELKGLPSATVITAEIDPLRSEGQALAERLKQAGVQTAYRNYDGVTHEFFGMGAVVADAAAAQDFAAGELRKALGARVAQAEPTTN